MDLEDNKNQMGARETSLALDQALHKREISCVVPVFQCPESLFPPSERKVHRIINKVGRARVRRKKEEREVRNI